MDLLDVSARMYVFRKLLSCYLRSSRFPLDRSTTRKYQSNCRFLRFLNAADSGKSREFSELFCVPSTFQCLFQSFLARRHDVVSRASTGHTSAGIIYKSRITYSSFCTENRRRRPETFPRRREFRTRGGNETAAPRLPLGRVFTPVRRPPRIHCLPGADRSSQGCRAVAERRIVLSPGVDPEHNGVHLTTRRRRAMMHFARVLPREVQSFIRRHAAEEPASITFISNGASRCRMITKVLMRF